MTTPPCANDLPRLATAGVPGEPGFRAVPEASLIQEATMRPRDPGRRGFVADEE